MGTCAKFSNYTPTFCTPIQIKDLKINSNISHLNPPRQCNLFCYVIKNKIFTNGCCHTSKLNVDEYLMRKSDEFIARSLTLFCRYQMFCSVFQRKKKKKRKKEGINLYFSKYYVKGEDKGRGTERESEKDRHKIIQTFDEE